MSHTPTDSTTVPARRSRHDATRRQAGVESTDPSDSHNSQRLAQRARWREPTRSRQADLIAAAFGPVDLSALVFSAKIDFVTIHTPGKMKLPKLSGKPKWPPEYHGRRLTIHDPSPADIRALAEVFGAARIVELEIANDVRPRMRIPPEDHTALMQGVMVDIFARGLEPSSGEGMSKEFRRFYRRLETGYMLPPFNLRLPRATDQQLHGRRTDPVQVKVYWKRTDFKADLAEANYSARVEVRMGSEGLFAHDLLTLTDLGNFRFRKNLMPYFRHVRGTQRVVRSKRSGPNDMLTLLAAKQHEWDQTEFKRVGVGAFVKGGKRAAGNVRLLRDTAINDRLGQALMRLERQLHAVKFVCPEPLVSQKNPMLARPSDRLDQSCMTI